MLKEVFSLLKGNGPLKEALLKRMKASMRQLPGSFDDLQDLDHIYLKQSYVYGEVNRDSGARVISVAYFALITIMDIDSEVAEKNGAHWRSLSHLPVLIFDHSEMVRKALKDLQDQVKIKPVGFELLPDKFTLVHLQELYEAIYQKNLDKRNFRKKILSMDILEKLDEKEKDTSKKGAFYYKFNKERYKKLKKEGFYFNLDIS